ncbi:MAG: hypothetical protein WCP55_20945 [Lentisphaerota bacterium]
MSTQENPQQIRAPQIKSKLLPVLVGILLCSLVGGLWFTLDQREDENLQNKIKAESVYTASHVDADLRTRLPSLHADGNSKDLCPGGIHL